MFLISRANRGMFRFLMNDRKDKKDKKIFFKKSVICVKYNVLPERTMQNNLISNPSNSIFIFKFYWRTKFYIKMKSKLNDTRW